jgi:hypothetical protein
LSEQPLASVNDTTSIAKWLQRNYDQQRDYLLERYYWKFALKRELLAADPVAPAWYWQYRYAIPADCLRLIPPTENGQWNGTPISFEQESGYLLCNVEGGLRFRYISRVTQEGLFSNGFCECLSLRLAYKMAHRMTGKQSMVAEITGLYREAMAEVKDAEAVQVASEAYYNTDILDDRVDYG